MHVKVLKPRQDFFGAKYEQIRRVWCITQAGAGRDKLVVPNEIRQGGFPNSCLCTRSLYTFWAIAMFQTGNHDSHNHDSLITITSLLSIGTFSGTTRSSPVQVRTYLSLCQQPQWSPFRLGKTWRRTIESFLCVCVCWCVYVCVP